MSATANNQHCQGKQLAAYLDGELDDETGAQLESHLKECPLCKAELTEQRRLLCALDSALSRNSAVALPKDFVRVVAAHAESDMRGIREPREHRRAFLFADLVSISPPRAGAT